MNKFIINEEEKRRILMMHQSATKRQYLNESTDGTKVKIFSDTSRTEIKDTAIIFDFAQDNTDINMSVELTSNPGNIVNGFFFMGEKLYYGEKGEVGYFSEEITEKLDNLRQKEYLSSDPMKVNVFEDGNYESNMVITDLKVVGNNVEFKWGKYHSNPQTNLDDQQYYDTSFPAAFPGKFSCNTKTFARHSYMVMTFSDEVTNKFMSKCDEYAMSNKDKESDMA